MINRRFLVLPAFLLLFPALAQQRRNPQEYIKCLESPERVKRLQVEQVIQLLQVSPGQRIADLGSGSGLFTRPLAKVVGERGMVYAVDVDPALLEHVRETAAAEALQNVSTILAAESDPQIPEPVDLIFICDTLHHIGGPAAYVKGLRRYLRPGGRIAVIDFNEKWPEGHENMKYTAEQLDEWMTAAGFSKTGGYGFLENAFFVVYQ